MRAELIDDRGDGLPVVYFPGIDATGELLFDTAAELRDRFRLLRLRYVAGGEDSYAALARSAAVALDRRGVRGALLLAESFGGAVALQTALDHRPLVGGLALVNTFAHFPARWSLSWTRLVAAVTPRRLWAVLRRRGAGWALFGEPPRPDLVERLIAATTGGMDRAYRARLRMIAGVDLRPRLAELDLPAAVFVGERDRVVPPRASLDLARRLGAATVRFPGGGHVLLPIDHGWAARLAAIDR